MRYAVMAGIRAVKEAVPIEEVAAEYTGGSLRQVGTGRYEARCPMPDHEDRTPSFYVFANAAAAPPRAQGSPGEGYYHCFGCLAHGDVVDLEQHCAGYTEVKWAMVALATRYGVELPERSERWHEATHRKAEYRRAAYRVLGQVLARRLFRTLILPYIDLIEDPEDREAELARAWEGWQQEGNWPLHAEHATRGDEDFLRAIAGLRAEAEARGDLDGVPQARADDEGWG